MTSVAQTASTLQASLGLLPPGRPAPEWSVSEWLNIKNALRLAELRGRVVVVHAFQMLCPGCVQHGLPQAQRIRAAFAPQDVAVVGLHTVFEHHAAMTRVSLEAFLHEYRVHFPVGIDTPSATAGDPIPQTMRTYGMQGTPTLLLIDRKGFLRRHAFGAEDDVSVGAAVASLASEAP